MRGSGDWMVLADDRILENPRENETAGATEMKEEGWIRYTRSYISQRLFELKNHGLVRVLGNGIYTITGRGEKYLDGQIDARFRPWPTVERVLIG